MKKVSRAFSTALVGSCLGSMSVLACAGGAPVRGSVSLSWSIFDALTGLPATCGSVGASAVVLQATPQAAAAGTSVKLSCEGTAGSGELAAGSYRVVPQLVRADGAVLSQGPEQAATVIAGKTTALAPVVLAGSTTATVRSGFLAASLAIGPSDVKNCQGGAGMTGVALVLAHGDGSCAGPLKLVRSRGGFLIGTYEAPDCVTPPVTSCIEADEQLTVGDLEPGSYILRVRGKKGGLECWTADEPFTLAAGTPLVHTFALTTSAAPGC